MVTELTNEIVSEYIERIFISEPKYIGWRLKKQPVRILLNHIGDISGVANRIYAE